MERIIPIDDIEDGMISSDEVHNSAGQVLIAAGAKLKIGDKRVLRKQNILTVCVKSDSDIDEFVMTDEIKQKAFKILSTRIKWKPRNENEQDIFQIALVSTAMKLIKNEQDDK